MKKNTLLLVFLHGFKGTDDTFGNFPNDLRALLAHTLPKIEIVSVQYPRYETRGDLKECVARFQEWLQNKVIDLEVANETPSPTIDPSVHVVLCGHSMGGIVAAETLLTIVKDSEDNRPSATMSEINEPTKLFFPYIQAIVAFDTPFLGISPGVLAHGAEEQINHASSAYKAFDSASSFFGWNSAKSAGGGTTTAIPDAANRGLPAPPAFGSSTGSGGGGGAWNKWGKYAALGGAAAALAGAAGAAYVNRNQISQGFAWAGSHLEFVGCLARGAELQKRVERVVQLTKSHGVGFADFYTALGEQVSKQTRQSGSLLGGGGGGGGAGSRTFCVVPKRARREIDSGSAGSRRNAQFQARRQESPSSSSQSRDPSTGPSPLNEEMQNGEQVQQFAEDTTKSKGHWVKCVNDAASDELKAHTSMFSPKTNPNYHTMVPMARDEIVQWVDTAWYESSLDGNGQSKEDDADAVGGGEETTEGVEETSWA